jgi:hypothetical protein
MRKKLATLTLMLIMLLLVSCTPKVSQQEHDTAVFKDSKSTTGSIFGEKPGESGNLFGSKQAEKGNIFGDEAARSGSITGEVVRD